MSDLEELMKELRIKHQRRAHAARRIQRVGGAGFLIPDCTREIQRAEEAVEDLQKIWSLVMITYGLPAAH